MFEKARGKMPQWKQLVEQFSQTFPTQTLQFHRGQENGMAFALGVVTSNSNRRRIMSNLRTKHTLAGLFGILAILFLLSPVLLLASDRPAPNHTGSHSSTISHVSNVATTNAASRANLAGIGRNEKLVSRFVAQMMEQNHLSNHEVDDEISRRALDRYIKVLDPAKAYFLQPDIDEFSKWQNRLDDQLKSGDYTAAFEMFQRLLQRIDERTTDALRAG